MSQQPYGQPQPPYQQPPFYPPVQPPKKKRNPLLLGCGIGACVLLVLIIAIVIISSALSSKASPNTGSTTTGTSTQPPTSATTFKVGQSVSVGSTWQITVLSARTSTGSQFNAPKAGNVFLIVTISAKNISSQSQDMSSLAQWNLADTSGQKYNATIDPDAGATLDGAVASGMPSKGVIVYEVPKSTHNFTLSFQSDITSSDQTIWTISV